MKRLTMRKIKEAVRLHANGLSMRKIAASLGVGHSTATDYMKRLRLVGLTWPLPTDMTDAALEALLFRPSGGPGRLVEVQPDWPAIHRDPPGTAATRRDAVAAVGGILRRSS